MKCMLGVECVFLKAILLTVSKWQKTLDLHLTTASHKSIWLSIDSAKICSIKDGKRQLQVST